MDMEIKFKILSLNEEQHSALVYYYSDFYPEGFTYNIEIRPDEDGEYPDQENFLSTIHLHTPVHLFEKQYARKQNKSIDHLLEFANTEHTYDKNRRINMQHEAIDEELNRLIQMMVNETKT
jgi:hypothetical protein